jgi:hypothetical protein
MNALDIKKYIHVNSIPFFNKIFFTSSTAELKDPIDFDALNLMMNLQIACSIYLLKAQTF